MNSDQNLEYSALSYSSTYEINKVGRGNPEVSGEKYKSFSRAQNWKSCNHNQPLDALRFFHDLVSLVSQPLINISGFHLFRLSLIQASAVLGLRIFRIISKVSAVFWSLLILENYEPGSMSHAFNLNYGSYPTKILDALVGARVLEETQKLRS